MFINGEKMSKNNSFKMGLKEQYDSKVNKLKTMIKFRDNKITRQKKMIFELNQTIKLLDEKCKVEKEGGK